MEKVKIFEIQIVTKRLSRHHFSIAEVSVRRSQDLPEKYHEGTGILMDNIRSRAEKQQDTTAEYLKAVKDDICTDQQEDPASQGDVAEEDITLPEKKKMFRKLKKPNLSLFEEVIDEKAILAEAIDKKINQDHYYDVIAPFDAENQIEIKNKKKGKRGLIISLLILLGVLMAALVWIIGSMVS